MKSSQWKRMKHSLHYFMSKKSKFSQFFLGENKLIAPESNHIDSLNQFQFTACFSLLKN